MSQFPEFIKKLLLDAGWDKKRQIDTAPFKQILEAEGYIPFPVIEDLLKEFGGLRIIFPRHDSDDSLHFNAEKASNDVSPYWAQENYAYRLNNKSLCIIGQAYSDHLTLMMDAEGKVYGGYDDSLFFIASNGREAICNICSNQKLEEMP
jgi:hypothetical protein